MTRTGGRCPEGGVEGGAVKGRPALFSDFFVLLFRTHFVLIYICRSVGRHYYHFSRIEWSVRQGLFVGVLRDGLGIGVSFVEKGRP